MTKTRNIYPTTSGDQIASWFVFGVAIMMLVLFLYTGINKLLEMNKFIFQMQLVQLPIMQQIAPILGWGVPIAELMIVILLCLERTRLVGLYASLALMMGFEGYIGWMKYSGLDLPCTCGGIISRMSWTAHFIFNAAMILLITAALIIYYTRLISKPV